MHLLQISICTNNDATLPVSFLCHRTRSSTRVLARKSISCQSAETQKVERQLKLECPVSCFAGLPQATTFPSSPAQTAVAQQPCSPLTWSRQPHPSGPLAAGSRLTSQQPSEVSLEPTLSWLVCQLWAIALGRSFKHFHGAVC